MALIPPKIPLIPGNLRKGKPVAALKAQLPLIPGNMRNHPAAPLLPSIPMMPGNLRKLPTAPLPTIESVLPTASQFIDGAPSGIDEVNKLTASMRSASQAQGSAGYAVPNRFQVIILPPRKLGGNSSDAQAISLRCESITLPGRNLGTLTDNNIYGPTREIVNGVSYAEDIPITFQSSYGLDERIFFERWQRLAFNEQTWDIGYYNDYISKIDIYVLDKQDTKRYGIRLHEAFPKTITGTDLNQGANNEIIKITVNFAFKYWTNLSSSEQAEDSGQEISDVLQNTVTRNLMANQPATMSKLNPFSFPAGPAVKGPVGPGSGML